MRIATVSKSQIYPNNRWHLDRATDPMQEFLRGSASMFIAGRGRALSAASHSGNTGIQVENFIFLIPTISAIALGIIFIPNFALGFAAGAGILVVTTAATELLTVAGLIEDIDEKRSEYAKHLEND